MLPDLNGNQSWMTSPKRDIERIQCLLTYLCAAKACRTFSTYGIEKRLQGENFRTVERTRFWERTAEADYRLYAHLAREQAIVTEQWKLLQRLTDRAEALRTYPLWALLPDKPISTFDLKSRSTEIERFCGYPIPRPPSACVSDADRYIDEVFCGALRGKELKNEVDVYARLLMGVYCLRSAVERSDLAQYVLTYEGLFNTFPLHNTYDIPWILWGEVLAHLNYWYRELEICPTASSAEEAINECANLKSYGINFISENCGKKALCHWDGSKLEGHRKFPDLHLQSFVGYARSKLFSVLLQVEKGAEILF
ncbi:hypothetical protein ACMAVI_001861 [Burkholderia cenocepacia]